MSKRLQGIVVGVAMIVGTMGLGVWAGWHQFDAKAAFIVLATGLLTTFYGVLLGGLLFKPRG